MKLDTMPAPENIHIVVETEGPYLVYGRPPIHQEIIACNADGEPWQYDEGTEFIIKEPTALCRCGKSKDKPYCDGSHKKIKWNSALTAPTQFPLEKAELTKGTDITLSDNEEYCAYARFCDAHGQIWNLVEDSETEEEKQLVLHEAAHCPSGRLIVWNKKTGNPIEPVFEPAIGILEDPALKISGPIWVRGGIRIKKEDGTSYDVRNRVTLCRCGGSSNKPFCDGSHAKLGFNDKLPLEADGNHF